MTLATIHSLAVAAHSGTSFSPGQRAASTVKEIEAHLAEARTWIAEHVAPERLETTYAAYEAGYLGVWRKYLHSRSGLVSWMIAGPSNFPVRRMEKKNRVVDKRLGELVEWPKRARARILREEHELTKPDDPSDELRAEIARKTASLELMKAVNKVVRKKKLTPEERVAAIVALGVSERTARQALEPDFAGRVGFPGYELTSLRGKIERLEANLRVITSAKEAPAPAAGALISEGAAFEIEEDIRDQRLRIHFAAKPDAAMIARLKRSGFKWSPRNTAWQRQLTANARAAADALLAGGVS